MPDVYECDKECGLCCQRLIIEIDHIDVVREPRLLPVIELLDGNGKIVYDSEWEKEYMLVCGKPCAMLGAENRCQIYPTRPNCCVAFAAGGEKCQELRQDYGLPPLQPKERT